MAGGINLGNGAGNTQTSPQNFGTQSTDDSGDAQNAQMEATMKRSQASMFKRTLLQMDHDQKTDGLKSQRAASRDAKSN